MHIDLHSHSTASDGTDPPAIVIARARAAGVDVLALTDHDTVTGHAEAAEAVATSAGGPALVPGCEISCALGTTSVHLLAYLFDPHEAALVAELHRVRTERERRAQGMTERLRELGVPVGWARVRELAGGETVGRPHLARAMVEAGAVPDVASAFTTEWLAPGGRAYVPRYAPDPADAIRLVRAAGGVTVLAHPGADERGGDVPGDEEIARLAVAGLAGLEVDHPGHGEETRRRLRGLAAEMNLVVTGGSDDHGAEGGAGFGLESTEPEEYERLVSSATGAHCVVG